MKKEKKTMSATAHVRRPRRPSVCRRVCPSGGAAKVCSSFPSSSALFRKRRTATIGHFVR